MNARVAVLITFLTACAGTGGGGVESQREVEFKAGDGTTAFELEWETDGVRVEDGAGNRLVRLRERGDRLAIENAQGREVGWVVPTSGERPGFRIVRTRAGNTVVELRREPDGDYKVINSKKELLYELKRRDYGFKVVDRAGKVESRIRSSPGKISVRDASGSTFLTTRDPLPVEAAAALTLDAIPFEFAVALAVAMTR